ncbi:hypothetical protein RvY_15462 [Ramazzottius varieornatus]|uniref:Uncharacterized protein n=1 Tax=Ramazzottius varieornatus TaxID=947166 RepID=A0A1D1VZN3_RAMVA|nr:hypothetical protein RvY_15462 [Ramazzottius varieornatus]
MWFFIKQRRRRDRSHHSHPPGGHNHFPTSASQSNLSRPLPSRTGPKKESGRHPVMERAASMELPDVVVPEKKGSCWLCCFPCCGPTPSHRNR